MQSTPLTDLLPLAEVARQCGIRGLRGAERVHPSTLWRWSTRGVRAADGTVHRLQVWRVGSRYRSTVEAVRELIARLTAASLLADAPSELAPTPARRARAARAATAEVGAILGS